MHEIIVLEILILLLENPCGDNVELAIQFIKECGHKLCEVNPRGLDFIFSKLKHLGDNSLKKYTCDMIEDVFAAR